MAPLLSAGRPLDHSSDRWNEKKVESLFTTRSHYLQKTCGLTLSQFLFRSIRWSWRDFNS